MFLTSASPLKNLLTAVAVASAAILGTALVSQYGFDLHPCELCLYQRYPYAAVIVLATVGAFFAVSAQWRRRIALLCVLLLLVDAGIAFYHAGVELEWFPGPNACSSTATGGETLEEMRRQIMEAPLVSCNQAMIHVLGLSMAAWNALAAFALAIFIVASLRYLKRTAP